jgi:hypothetical protein
MSRKPGAGIGLTSDGRLPGAVLALGVRARHLRNGRDDVRELGTTLLADGGVDAASATYALAAFWAAVTGGRLVIAIVSSRVGSTRIYVVLPG